MYSCSKIKCLQAILVVTFLVVNLILYNLSALDHFVNFIVYKNSSTKGWGRVQLYNVSNMTASVIEPSMIPTTKSDDVIDVFDSSWLADRVPSTMNIQLIKLYPFLRDSIVNPHSFNYTLFPSMVNCSDQDTEFAICVVSSRNNFDGRQTIRETWGNYSNFSGKHAVLVFFIGSELNNTKSETQRLIEEEAKAYGDIIQESYIDHYKNLSLKTVSIVKWFSNYCLGSKYLLKADDDLYVNVPLLSSTITDLAKSMGKTAFVVGHEYLRNKANRDKTDKFYTPLNMFKGETYPRYVLGGAYAMTAQAAWLLYEASLRVPLLWIEDIYLTGLCAIKAEVSVIHSNLFSFGRFNATGCAFRNHIAHHKYSMKEIRLIHTQLYDPYTVCKNK